MSGMGHRLQKLENERDEVSAEIISLKLTGQGMANELRFYKGLADTVAYNLELPAFDEQDYDAMNTHLEEWTFWSKVVRKEIYKQIDEITVCYSVLADLNNSIMELLR